MTVLRIRQRLYRSNKDKIIAGICGGLSDYFDVDTVIFRAMFILLTFVSGIGLLLYVILWIAIPRENEGTFYKSKSTIHIHKTAHGNSKNVYANVATNTPRVPKKRCGERVIVVTGVIFIGTAVLFSNLFSVSLLKFEIIWSLLLILIGVYLISAR